MKYLAYVLLWTLPSVAFAFEFFNGDDIYNTQKVSAQLSKQYGADLNITTLVVAWNKQGSENAARQWDEVSKLDAEALELIYVSAVSDEQPENGYQTSLATAKNLLGSQNFKLILIAPSGDKITELDRVVNADELKKLIKR